MIEGVFFQALCLLYETKSRAGETSSEWWKKEERGGWGRGSFEQRETRRSGLGRATAAGPGLELRWSSTRVD